MAAHHCIGPYSLIVASVTGVAHTLTGCMLNVCVSWPGIVCPLSFIYMRKSTCGTINRTDPDRSKDSFSCQARYGYPLLTSAVPIAIDHPTSSKVLIPFSVLDASPVPASLLLVVVVHISQKLSEIVDPPLSPTSHHIESPSRCSSPTAKMRSPVPPLKDHIAPPAIASVLLGYISPSAYESATVASCTYHAIHHSSSSQYIST